MAKPTEDITWAVNSITDPGSGQANKIEPSTAKQDDGWVFLEKPPFNWYNYWMNGVYKFIKWIIDDPLEGTFTFAGIKTFSDTTQSTTKDTGVIIVDGGVGIEKDVVSGGKFFNDNAYSNSIFGKDALLDNTTGVENSAYGENALATNIIGDESSAFGYHALAANTANSNSAFGHTALLTNTTGAGNNAFGFESLKLNTIGDNCCAFGNTALKANTTGVNNCAFGIAALANNTIGNDCCAYGEAALTNNTTGVYNCAFGSRALVGSTIGQNCAAFGRSALTTNSTGSQNSAFGASAGASVTTGTNLTCLGYNAQPTGATATNEITLGDANVATLRCQVTTITALSDIRDKVDIDDLEFGLDMINAVRPVRFRFDCREWYDDGKPNGSKADKDWQIGFIAQEFEALQEKFKANWLNLVYRENPEKLEASSGKLLTIAIKAIQELSKKIDVIEEKLNGI